MDRPREWIGARIEWRIRVADGRDVAFEGGIDTAEDYGDRVIRISGERVGGGRFVLVTDQSSLATA